MVMFNKANSITPCQGIGRGGFCRQTDPTLPTTHKSTFDSRKRISCPPRTDRECPRPKMNYHYRYYSFAEVLHFRTKTKTEILYTSLRLIESDLPDFITPLLFARDQGREANAEMLVKGLYCSYDESDKLLSVAILKDNKIDRILTMPSVRRRGHAVHLIQHLTQKFTEAGCPVIFSPVYSHIGPLFEKAGWVLTGSTCERDGTVDYCPSSMLHICQRGGTVTWDRRLWIRHLLSCQTHLMRR